MTEDPIKILKLYNGEVTIVYDDIKHRYYHDVHGGKEIQGVSSAMSSVFKPLHIWTLKVGINYLRERFSQITTLTRDLLEDMFEGARKAHYGVKNKAADSGTSTHKMVEMFIKGEKVNYDPSSKEGAKYDQFLKFVAEYGPTFHDSERVVYSKEYDYVGTFDFTCTIDGKKYLGDLKTGTSIFDSYFMQTSAYQHALEEETGEKYDGRVIVLTSYVEPTEEVEGGPSLQVVFRDNETYAKDFGAFRAALYLTRWGQKGEWDDENLLIIENLEAL